MDTNWFQLRTIEWRQLFHQYTTPREWKKGARDVPFGLGAKTLYVDGDDGNDHNDGLSWKTAFKTIQHAIDEADSWTNIYVRDGTYVESVVVPSSKKGISLLGESSTGTIIQSDSTSDPALRVEADKFHGQSFHCKSADGSLLYSIICNFADFFSLFDVRSSGLGTDPLNLLIYSSKNFLIDKFVSSGTIGINISSCPQILPCPSIVNCYFDGSCLNIANQNSNYIIVSNCHFVNANSTYGAVRFYSSASGDEPKYNLVTHCNFINCDKVIKVHDAPDNYVLENYYSSHSNIDNGFGIATEPFVDDLTDPRPVVIPAGWLALSWADADQVALASVCTEERLAELDAANIPADIDTLLSRLTAARAGYLDNLSGGAVALASVCTDARLAELDAANMPADLDTLLSRLTSTRAGYLDELDFDLDARLGSPVSSIAGDIADLITRTKGLNDIHDDLASVGSDLATVDSVVDSILANQKKYWHWHVLRSDEYRVVRGTWSLSTYTDQYLGCLLYNSSNSFDDEIAIPCFVPSTDARTLNVRCMTNIHSGIFRVYVDDQLQGTIDFYSSSTQYNVIKTISITPVRAGINVISLVAFDSNPSSDGVYCYLSEMWLT